MIRVLVWAITALASALLTIAYSPPVSASPMVANVGSAHVTLVLSPDPPQTGRISGIISLDGVPVSVLATTKATFGTAMPTMSMSGPSGSLAQTSPGRWQFTFSSAMATTWTLSVHFSGGLSGTADFRFAVGSADGAGSTPMAGMAGMNSAGGNPEAWKWAALALVAVLAAFLIAVVVRKDRRPLTLALVAGAAVVVLAFAALQSRYAPPAMDMSAMSSVHGDAATPVRLAPVRVGRVDSDIHAPGTISPLLTQDIVARASGILSHMTLYAGDRVARGQIVAVLDAPDLGSRAAAADADARAQVATARAAEVEAHHHAPDAVIIARADTASLQRDISAADSDRNAKSEQARYWQLELTREKRLLDQGAVSVQEYEDERAQAAVARSAALAAVDKVTAMRQQLIASQTKVADAAASVTQMQAQAIAARSQAAKAEAQAATEATFAGYRTVRSPDDAIVVKRVVDPGVYVQAGTVIARVAVVRRLRIAANVAQQDLASVAVGMPMEAKLQDGRIVRGRISSISPTADATTHTAAVEAIVDNEQAQLIAGGFAQVLIHARSRSAVGSVGVPSVAVVGVGGDSAVWTDVNGTAHRVSVHVLNDDGTTATVTGDLGRAAHVVTDGAATLQEGQAIAENPA